MSDRWSNDDAKEKRRLGEPWALKSNGTCRFVMPQGKDRETVRGAATARATPPASKNPAS